MSNSNGKEEKNQGKRIWSPVKEARFEVLNKMVWSLIDKTVREGFTETVT